MTVNLIIPMVGRGTRFKQAGIKEYKPFISILDLPMINYVLQPFPSNVHKIFICNPDLLSEQNLDVLEACPNSSLIKVEGHSLGPAYSIYQALEELQGKSKFFIAYTDIFWSWDYPSVEKLLDEDGIVFTRTGFHPHLVNNNYSAFCLPKPDQTNQLEAIKEKSSFTDNWMNEPLSIGAFYVKRHDDLEKAIKVLLEEQQTVNNEYFPSLIFNELIKLGRKIRLHEVDFFIHWGIPEQLADFEYWNQYFKKQNNKEIRSTYIQETICCMGGQGKRMQSISPLPKALINISGKPMVSHVIDCFKTEKTTLIATKKMIENLKDSGVSSDFFAIPHQTSNQIETLQLAKSCLIEKNNFLLVSCDAWGDYNPLSLEKLITTKDPDIIIFTYQPSLLQKKMEKHHTYVSVSDQRITKVHIKSKSSDQDYGLAGFFWFKNGALFQELEDMPLEGDNEPCIDHYVKYLIE